MKTKQIFNSMQVISWVIFIGLCVKVGALILSFFVSLFKSHEATKDLYLGLDLSGLYDFNISHYVVVILLIILITSLKAYMFYLVIKIFKIIDYNKPFKIGVSNLVSRISYVSLFTALIAFVASAYSIWLTNKIFFIKVNWGASEFLFMAGVIFVLAELFKRAIQIQTENDLTI
ncbi:DUF2975 domain-containing protein [uncultured Psychroserpens sp.]|uniref:DUF2975 domain-containing protein n=1 Tax=uncultured Psychroserpens sp. TaxID=255436 RepID=UPI002632C1D1|nr:DUF2975 domain-containing protein [uncultured Psychroserpens sp.]